MWIIYLILALALLLIVAIVLIAIRYKLNYWGFFDVAHEKPKTILEIFREMRGADAFTEQLTTLDPEHINELYKRFKGTGPFCGFYQLLRPTVLVLERELCKQILINDFANFNDRGHYYNVKTDPLAAHLHNLRGKSWQDMRPRVESLLSEKSLKHIFECLERESQNLLRCFELKFEESEELQLRSLKVQPLILRYVSDTLATCIFGLSPNDLRYPLSGFYDMVQEALQAPLRHGRYIQGLLYQYPSLSKKLGLAITAPQVHAYFMELITNVVNERELSKLQVGDYMQLLINMKQERFRFVEREDKVDASAKLQQRLLNELAAQAYVFLQTGFEATAKTLSYALLELSLQQELQQRVRQEVRETKQRHDNRLSYDCVMELELLGQVLQETIRHHPITPYLTRKTLADYRVSGNSKYVLMKNMLVVIPVHAMHNDPEYFPEPHLFRPERFATQSTQSRASCTWLGFGEGPRSCIALRFAQLQMRLTLALLLERYEFSVDLVRPMPSWTDGIELIVKRIEEQQ